QRDLAAVGVFDLRSDSPYCACTGITRDVPDCIKVVDTFRHELPGLKLKLPETLSFAISTYVS
ncbi:MAG: hypothetical protein ABIP49_06315, partial [Lysobacterales bacterium]